MARGAELVERRLCGGEGLLGLVEPALLEQGTPEHKLCAADLVDVVLVAGGLEQLQRVPRLLLRLLDVAGAQVNLGERRDGAARVGVATDTPFSATP